MERSAEARRNFSPYELFLATARSHLPRYRFAGAFPAWRTRAKPAVLATLGRLPAQVDPHPELVAEWRDGPLLRQRWHLDVQPGLSAVAYVNRPADLTRGERRPGILCWHGHTAAGKEPVMGEPGEDVHRGYGRHLAEAGFVTFAIDWMGYGDLADDRKPHHRAVGGGHDRCDLYYLHATMLGMTPLGMNLAYGRKLVDFASELPFVDPDRLGVVGLSGGGTLTLWSALLDERLRAAEIVCYSDLFADFAYRDANYCGSQVTPGLYELVDVPDLQGLLAPLPLLVDIGAHDECFLVDSALACHQRVREIYAAAGAAERLELNLFAGGHRFDPHGSAEFFARALETA
ncbi:dienelactone hydrolase family protein [Tenggerimyces flavus]|uniref:Acetylxylan esterase n=1 Tax=Tenggerimyces flavus TaxID=1708749 RepID=A0ABV7YJK7_9ACTN|nr:acetylxylan esterase [Tenggerimyces flavus]MBM7789664.1 dienelactone hydrolase [Tenggerimyces flavus]